MSSTDACFASCRISPVESNPGRIQDRYASDVNIYAIQGSVLEGILKENIVMSSKIFDDKGSLRVISEFLF